MLKLKRALNELTLLVGYLLPFNYVFKFAFFIKCKQYYFHKYLINDISFISLTIIYLPLFIHEIIDTRHCLHLIIDNTIISSITYLCKIYYVLRKPSIGYNNYADTI